jgi:signal transduction histidine kinase
MALSWFRERLFPGEVEREPRFRHEVLRLGHSGLRVLGGIEVAVPVFMHFARWIVLPGGLFEPSRLLHTGALVTVGAVTILVARLKWSRPHGRRLAAVSALLAASVLIGSSLLTGSRGVEDYIPAGLTLVMLSTVAAVPLQPPQTLALGVSIELLYLISSALLAPAMTAEHHVFIMMLTALSTVLSATLYVQRISNYRAQQETVRSTEILANAQTRALLSESAVSVGKLAAALTHEINSPLGALKSSLDTLLALAARQATAPPSEQPRLVRLQADLRRSVEDAANRIRKAVAPLQRFIDLDKDELQPANINELLSDVAILFERQIQGSVKLEFDLQPLPTLTCRPQQLTAVFSSLLSNALKAVNGDGAVVMATRRKNSEIEVTIRDSGRGMSSTELETIFDPGFKVLEGRVSTGNWSLFSSRQIIFEHGGEIRIDSAQGKGTTVSVTLPC